MGKGSQVMSTGSELKKIATVGLLGSGLLCAAVPAFADAAAQAKPQVHRKTTRKKQVEPPPPLPSGPTGRPVQQMPLDAIAAVPPQVTYENNQLTIVAPNSTLADILRAVRKQTGADIEIPAAPERVVTHLGPGPPREVVADLLNGSRFNYVLLGSPSDQSALTRVVLVAKTGPQEVAPSPVVAGNPAPENQAVNQAEPESAAEANEAEAADDNNNADDNADQPAAEAEQQPPQDQQQGIKTPQQMLQEMQQRQMQLQQQQPPGQPPIPGSGMPPHPPQEN
jgi:hypothetical protein